MDATRRGVYIKVRPASLVCVLTKQHKLCPDLAGWMLTDSSLVLAAVVVVAAATTKTATKVYLIQTLIRLTL